MVRVLRILLDSPHRDRGVGQHPVKVRHHLRLAGCGKILQAELLSDLCKKFPVILAVFLSIAHQRVQPALLQMLQLPT